MVIYLLVEIRVLVVLYIYIYIYILYLFNMIRYSFVVHSFHDALLAVIVIDCNCRFSFS